MELKLLNDQGQSTESVSASDKAFGREYNEALVHQVVTAYMANARQGTRAQKDRSEVKHSTKKPWRQKGTGRARAGSRRATQWRGGQTVFGPVVRDHGFSLNKKVRRLALKTALSSKQAEGKLVVLEAAKLDDAKTKALADRFSTLGWSSALIIDGPEIDANFARAARNIPNIDVLPQQGLNVYDNLRRDVLVLTRDAVKHLVERLA
jgi:large subunit ribosomal protein L4